ncbi:MAG: DNA repair protein RadA [Firmicutes bacterium]|nr:DNA repair protein RadA [Bacillota bacterium]
MAAKTRYVCSNCGYETVKWLGKCPDCGSFSTLNEEATETVSQKKISPSSARVLSPVKLKAVSSEEGGRTKTDIGELDIVLGGGFVQGSLTLVGGDPGIGKSTLLLQICQKLEDKGKTVLYVSGEESAQQIKLRAERLKVTGENLLLLAETDVNSIISTAADIMPDMLIIDSIQTMFLDSVASAPGSVTQVRECANRFMQLAKGHNISVVLVGHVTKEGAIAGPRVLEHIVDTVLYFEGQRNGSYRLLRSVKNRFGGTNEIGVFEMSAAGLREVKNPSEYMLSGRPEDAAGSVITCIMEGSRPMLIEVQSLVTYTNFGIPRRMATGTDFNRVTMLIAVLEKCADLQLGNYDSYVNLAGGMKITETSLDCAVACAIASAYKNKLVPPDTVIFGEIGLTGEIRGVSMAQKRVQEIKKLGFKRCILPRANLKEAAEVKGIDILCVNSVAELLKVALK